MRHEREGFRSRAARVDPKRLYFFDEFGFNLSMTRLYARAPSSERAYGKVPVNRGAAMTLVLGLGREGVVEPLALEGSMNGALFGAYMVEQVIPNLPPGAIVIVDNLGAHRSDAAIDALEARGVRVVEHPDEARLAPDYQGIQLWFLPAYSPELSPAEECGSKVKALTRAKNPRTTDDLIAAMGQAIGQVTPHDAEGWFEHAARDRQPTRRASRAVASRPDEAAANPG